MRGSRLAAHDGRRAPRDPRRDDPLGPGGRRGAHLRRLVRAAAPSIRRRGHAGGQLLDRGPAAQRDRLPAHGPRPQQLDSGRARSASTACAAARRCGCWAPTTPASAPRRWSRSSSPPEGVSRHDLGREAFVERVWQWREKYGERIIDQFKRLGASCDYERERFTLDEGYVRAVYRVFVALHAKGLIYRDNYIVNWDPGLRSAISDLEVENREVSDRLYSIDYPVEDSDEVLTVATVRPETMLADTAVAIHPDDERYRHLVGGHCLLPLVGRRLPIIADEHVDPEFGTGALKITPGHDPNDFEIGRRHGLEEIVGHRRGRAHQRGRGRAFRRHDDRRGTGGGGRAASRAGPVCAPRRIRRTRSRSRIDPARGSSR